jgi:hypothetical protein
VYRFTVGQYHHLIKAGVLGEDDRVELIEGMLTAKLTHNPPHDCAVSLAQAELLSRLPRGWILRVQSAITLSDSEPEPDLVIARGPTRRYARSHPKPRDIALAVEVADATLEADRTDKLRVYARARIAVYWILNLIDEAVEVYSEPRGGKAPVYGRREDHAKKDSVPLTLAGRALGSIRVRDLLP